MVFTATRQELYAVLREKCGSKQCDQKEFLLKHLVHKLDIRTDDEGKARARRFCHKFCSTICARLRQCGRNMSVFMKKHQVWLAKQIDFSPILLKPRCTGRPKIQFCDSSIRSKRRKTEHLRNPGTTGDELLHAAQIKFWTEGNTATASLLKEASSAPGRAKEIQDAYRKCTDPATQIQQYTPEEALSIVVEASLSKRQYNLLRTRAMEKNINLYPAYNKVREAKKLCYPTGITVTESEMEVKLQPLVDHTARRIVQVQEPVFSTLPSNLSEVTSIHKWGLDGSSGYFPYKQRAEEENLRDSDLFVTSLVPLQLAGVAEDSSTRIIWQNPRPASTRYCRPIHLQFRKETTELIKNEKEYVDQQINSLEPTIITVGDHIVTVHHSLHFTMIDGKVCSAVSNTPSTQRCNVCNATPTEMNKLDLVKEKPVNETTLQYGVSPLHAYIRFFEYCIHVSYRLEIKRWAIPSGAREKVNARKRAIQTEFRKQMGLIVDEPRQGGSGNSNDGNTSRRFFAQPAESAAITGLDEGIIRRLSVILQVLASTLPVNITAFDQYALDTAQLILTTYPWYYMPPSMHKVLLHGGAIMSAAVLPVGALSEEAQEARNKDCKRFRENHTRKFSRTASNLDLVHALLLSSDPVISSMRNVAPRKTAPLHQDVIALLQEPNLLVDADSESE